MRLLYQYLLPLLGLFLGREVFTPIVPLLLPVQVLKVLDGDTVELGGGMRVRLAGIDAPEKDQPSLLGPAAGAYSAQCLRALVAGQGWELEWRGRDVYGRVLGDLWRRGARLSTQLLGRGCVGLYPYQGSFPLPLQSEWRAALVRAQRARRGVWQWGGYRRPYWWRKAQKVSRAPVATE